MATTTNYSWTTPDDTAVVKDGAAAIRSLGTAIDTTVFNNASAAIAKTIVDAKGDIIAATAADTVSRLAVGANDTVLTADSSTATGLKWAAPAAPATGANWSFLNSGGTTLTAATTITVSGISSADKILIAWDGASANASSEIGLRFNTISTSSYIPQGMALTGASSWSATNFASRGSYPGTDQIRVSELSNNASSTTSGYCLISGANAAGVKAFNLASGTSAAGGNGHISYAVGGVIEISATFTSVSIISSSGNFDSGKIYVYTSA